MLRTPFLLFLVSWYLTGATVLAADLYKQEIAAQRTLLREAPKDPQARQRLAEIGWQLARDIEDAEAVENPEQAATISHLIQSSLPDIVWRTRHNADQRNDPRALLAQAVFLRRGILMEASPREACKYYRKLSASEDAIGNWQYSRCVQSIDPRIALELAEAAARAGHPEAMQYVAEQGLTSQEAETRKQSVQLLRKAADSGRASAVLLLGALHETGTVVQADLVAAAGYYRQLAEQGHTVAQNNLGALLQRDGKTDEAIYWYQKAAEAHLAVAQLNLGLLMAGEQPEDCDALHWIRQAAEAGLALASRVLKDPEPYHIQCQARLTKEQQP